MLGMKNTLKAPGAFLSDPPQMTDHAHASYFPGAEVTDGNSIQAKDHWPLNQPSQALKSYQEAYCLPEAI